MTEDDIAMALAMVTFLVTFIAGLWRIRCLHKEQQRVYRDYQEYTESERRRTHNPNQE